MSSRIVSLLLSVFALLFRQNLLVGVSFGILLIGSSSVLPIVYANEEHQHNPVEKGDGMIKITFRNELPEPVVLFYDGKDGRIAQNRGELGELGEPIAAKGGEITISSATGHNFSYQYGGHIHYETAYATSEDDRTSLRVLLAGKNEITVQCTVTANKQLESLNIRIIPWWAPHGASHFLALVRSGYYNGAALNRVVNNFLTQFGISADYETRTYHRSLNIRDDTPLTDPVPFQPGMLSYAGSGENSRTTEVFVVMPGTSQGQLEYFGVNPWETPFGIIDQVEQTAVANWFSYGDMPPWVRFDPYLDCYMFQSLHLRYMYSSKFSLF